MSNLDDKGLAVVSSIEACKYGDIALVYGSSNRGEVAKALLAFREYVQEVQSILTAALAAQTKEDSK